MAPTKDNKAEPRVRLGLSVSPSFTPISPVVESAAILLDDLSWQQFVDALEEAPRAIPEVVELFRSKAPWD